MLRQVRAHLLMSVALTALLGAPAVNLLDGVLGGAPAAAAGTAVLPKGMAPLRVAGSNDVGPLSQRPMAVTIELALRHQGALRDLLAGQSTPGRADYHHYLTPADFAARFGPAQTSVDAVQSWAASHGLSVASVSPNRTQVRVTGSSASLGQAMGVAFRVRQEPTGSTYITTDRPATLPTRLLSATAAVLGLSNLGQVRVPPEAASASVSASATSPAAVVPSAVASTASSSPAGIHYPSSYGPQGIDALYHASTSTTAGAGQTMAVLAEGDLTQLPPDLRSFEARYGLPQAPLTVKPTGPGSSDTTDATEWDLDSQYASGLAPGASLVVYDAPSLYNSDVAAEINQFVTDNLAKQANFSGGECELVASYSGMVTAVDAALQQGAAQGQTLFTASGDVGAASCADLESAQGLVFNPPGANYPASSPYAVAVGGTSVLGSPARHGEIAWAGGVGGISVVEGEPSYQAHVGGSYIPGARGVPDVSLDADPNSGYQVTVGAQQEIVGGTSAASPAWLGFWTTAQAAHGGALGFANPIIYAEPRSAFHDITAGSQPPYRATRGYDYTTGRGTPDVTVFINAA